MRVGIRERKTGFHFRVLLDGGEYEISLDRA